MAQGMKGVVEQGKTQEFGRADIRVRGAEPLFRGLPKTHRVWMSHGDHVAQLPAGFQVLADTPGCTVAAMGDLQRNYYGVQFHLEVVHTKYGSEILKNFVVGVCGCKQDWHPEDRVEQLIARIRKEAH